MYILNHKIIDNMFLYNEHLQKNLKNFLNFFAVLVCRFLLLLGFFFVIIIPNSTDGDFMDFITEAFDIRISNAKTGDKKTLLQARIEYLYYFLLGYLWNLNKDSMTPTELTNFVNLLNGKLTLGSIVVSLEKLDKQKLIIDSNAKNMFIKYNKFRNEKIGHGYVFCDGLDKAESMLDDIYKRFVSAIDLLSSKLDIVAVTDRTNDGYEGRVYHFDKNGSYDVCKIPDGILDINDDDFPQIFFRKETLNTEYYKISPFVRLDGDDYNPDVFIFNMIVEKSTGKTRFNQFFKTGDKTIDVTAFKNISVENKFRIISPNGTRINHFELNYKRNQYIDVGILEQVRGFVVNNKSSVAATLWGCGGIGKTACVQELCEQLMNESKAHFSYIVFVSAKNRKFNEAKGEVVEALNNTNTFRAVIATAYETIFEKALNCDENSKDFQDAIDAILSIQSCKNGKALLLIIDDFETFADDEKSKINNFIYNKTNTLYHKVIITTRNKKLLTTVTDIPTSKLDPEKTVKFVEDKMKLDNSCDERIYANYEKWIKNEGAREKLARITGGIPLFILQWINLLKGGRSNELLSQDLTSSEEAIKFLFGKVYESLSDNAQKLYIAIPKVVDESKLNFHKFNLRAACCGVIQADAEFYDALEELEEMLVVQSATEDGNIFSVYSEGFLVEMLNRFKETDEATRNSIDHWAKSIRDKNVSLLDSYLKEADNSQVLGNKDATVKKYEKVLKWYGAPKDKRRKALLSLLCYLHAQRDFGAAIDNFNKYGKDFYADPDIMYQIIYTLQSYNNKNLTIEEIERYFDRNISINDKNLKVYALASSFYIRYYKNTDEYQNAIGIGKKLYDFASARSKTNPGIMKEPINKHNITEAFSHLLDVVISFDEHKDFANELAAFIRSYCDNNKLVRKVEKTLKNNKTKSPKIETDANQTGELLEGTVTLVADVFRFNKEIGQREAYTKRAEITGDNQEIYHVTKGVFQKIEGGLQEGERVSFTSSVNTHPNAGDKAQIAINIRKI